MKTKLSINSFMLLLSLLPTCVIGVMEYRFVSQRNVAIDQEFLERSQLIAKQLAANAEYGVFSNNRDFLQAIAEATVKQANANSVTITNNHGEIMAHAGAAAKIESHPTDHLQHVSIDSHFLMIVQPITPTPIALDHLTDSPLILQPIGAVHLRMSRLYSSQLKNQLLLNSLLISITFIAMTFSLVYAMTRIISGRVRVLSVAVEAIGAGKLDTRVPENKAPISELNTLASGINDTAEKLQQEKAILQDRVDQATEALRLQKEAAECLGRNKSHLLALASHDLRQPMQALYFYLEELKRNIGNDSQAKIVGLLESSFESLTQLLDSLMDISRLDAGALKAEITTCEIAPILEHLHASFTAKSAAKNIRFIVRPSRTAKAISSDPLLLERILMNLTSNAVRYTPPNGTILIACRQRGDNLRIEVRDNGPGIEPIQKSKIFDAFYRATNDKSTDGLGLGLSIVKRLCELLGHTLNVRSVVEQGSVFSIDVLQIKKPRQLKHAEEENIGAPESVEQDALKACRILLVDDDPGVLNGLQNLLHSWGCDVSAHDSYESVSNYLKHVNQACPKLVLTDYHLKEGPNGLELLNLVRKTFDAPDIPGILVTADVSSKVKELVGSVSKVSFVPKPVRPARLKSLLLYCINQRANSQK